MTLGSTVAANRLAFEGNRRIEDDRVLDHVDHEGISLPVNADVGKQPRRIERLQGLVDLRGADAVPDGDPDVRSDRVRFDTLAPSHENLVDDERSVGLGARGRGHHQRDGDQRRRHEDAATTEDSMKRRHHEKNPAMYSNTSN